MFQTLRQEFRGDRQFKFIAETTRAPFEKKSQGKFARVACNLCRGKKLKCTAAKEGCQRCREKGLRCFYGSSSPSIRHSTATAEAAGSEAALPPPSSVETAPDGSAPETMEDDGPDVFDNDTALYEFLQADADLEPPEPPISDCLFFDAEGMVPSLHGTIGLSDTFAQGHTQGALTQTTAPEGALVVTDLSSALPSNSGNNNSLAGSSSNYVPSRHSCGCFDLLRIFEAAEIYLVWATRASSPGNISFKVDDVLSCQKEILDRCDLRLQCSEYPLKSWDAMLLICICDKVLASIVKVKAAVDPGPAQSTRHPQSSHRRQSFLNPESSPPSEIEHLPIKSHFTGTGLAEWKFDEEDQRHVLQSLLCSRLNRLRALIQTLEEVVMSNRWLVPHLIMIRDLSDQISRTKPNKTDNTWPG